jgi:transcriptional regulator with XRE-family HTH domain
MDGSSFASALRDIRMRRNLSQLELARRAGTTQRYVSFIESGRSLPGRQLVLRLGESLELPLRERNDLLLAAGYAPVYPQTDLEDPALRPVLDALQHILDGHLPYPAIVIDSDGDLVAANQALDVLTQDVSPELLEPPVNVYRLALHPAGMAARIRNLAEWASHILERLRQEARRNPGSQLTAMLTELEGYVAGSGRHAEVNHLGFAVPLRLDSSHGELRLLTTVTTFATAVDVTIAELKLEAFLPADEATKAILDHRSAFTRPARPTVPAP